MEDCLFCKIAKKEIPSDIVYENNDIIAFKDINPEAPIHILVVPKKHIESIAKLEREDYDVIPKIYMAINEIVEKLGVKETGFRVVSNCGKDAGQTVMHLHFHILAGKDLGIKICNN